MFLLYLPAFIVDLLIFFLFFFLMYRAGEKNFSSAQCAAIMISSLVSYTIGSFTIGFIVNKNNARKLLYVSIISISITSAACIFSEEFKMIIITLLLFGIASALFWNSFQAVMRNQTPKGNLARSVGLYTLAWSAGTAAGTLISGGLYELGKITFGIVALAIAPILLIIMRFIRSNVICTETAEDHIEQGSRAVTPIYLWIGWILIFAACFLQRGIQTYFPVYCAKASISPELSGAVLFTHLIFQALTGFFFQFFRNLLYRKLPFIIIGLLTSVAILFAGFFPDKAPILFIVYSIFGIYTGFAFFCAVYYSSNYGRRSFNVGVNEFLVGLGGIAGVIFSAKIVDMYGTEVAIYFSTSVSLILFTIIQFCMVIWSDHKRIRKYVNQR